MSGCYESPQQTNALSSGSGCYRSVRVARPARRLILARNTRTAVATTTKASKKSAECESNGTGTGGAATALAVKSSMATVLTDVGAFTGAAANPILATCWPEIN